MIARTVRARSGITLTEILISILIMGVGLISLATLFPLGLLRLRDAQRQSRSALLLESAVADMSARQLLDKSTFLQTYYQIDPFLSDALPLPLDTIIVANQISGGLPMCLDPLWFSVNNLYPLTPSLQQVAGSNPAVFAPSLSSPYSPTVVTNNFPAKSFSSTTGVTARFGASATLGAPGLQRLTNFVPWCAAASQYKFTYVNPGLTMPGNFRDMAEQTFVSPEDIVMQNDSATEFPTGINTAGTSGVVPLLKLTSYDPVTQIDYRFSWFFTGRQIDVLDDTQFSGDIVVVENRQFGAEVDPAATGITNASGEFVMNAIFGAGSNNPGGAANYFATGASRNVLLSWPATSPDPEIKVGSWFADVTYKSTNVPISGSLGGTVTSYPPQRCNWYQVTKRSDVITNGTNRQMTVTTATPVKAQTLLTGTPYAPAAGYDTAVFVPGVINVFSRTFYVR